MLFPQILSQHSTAYDLGTTWARCGDLILDNFQFINSSPPPPSPRIVQLTLSSEKLPTFTPSDGKVFGRWATWWMRNWLHVFVVNLPPARFVWCLSRYPTSGSFFVCHRLTSFPLSPGLLIYTMSPIQASFRTLVLLHTWHSPLGFPSHPSLEDAGGFALQISAPPAAGLLLKSCLAKMTGTSEIPVAIFSWELKA